MLTGTLVTLGIAFIYTETKFYRLKKLHAKQSAERLACRTWDEFFDIAYVHQKQVKAFWWSV
jgi:hypothetical protein